MAEIRSAVEGLLKPGTHGATATDGATLQLSEKPTGALYQVAGWEPEFTEHVGPVLSTLGFSGLGNYRSAQQGDGSHCFRLAPSRLLIRHERIDVLERALENLNASTAPVVDLSHARTIITIRGSASEDLMARIATLDFAPQQFGTGDFAQTEIHHTGVLIHRTDNESFDVYIPSTWSQSLTDYICVCASVIGYRV